MTNTPKPVSKTIDRPFPDKQAVYRALSESQFVPFFQPLITLRTGQLAGFEVLARWKHPTEGIIPPDKFVLLAERDGWIGELTRQVLKKALIVAAKIPGSFTIAFNLSPVQLRDLSVPGQIREIATETDFPLSRLVIEITESALIENTEQAVLIVGEFKTMGCKLALDDFGTGYSSLRHLQSLPFDELKVDRSFVSSMTGKQESRKIVSAVVGLGQSLGLVTVAEGIETQEQAEIMIYLGCELGQGYLFGRPIPIEELAGSVSVRRLALVADSKRVFEGVYRDNLEFSPSQRLAQLQALYDGAPVGLGFLDRNLRFVNLNQKLADIHGASVESGLGVHVSQAVPQMFPHLEPYLRRALGGEAIFGIEVINPATGGTRLINYQPAIDEAGEVVGIAVAVTDIADQMRVGSTSEENNNHFVSMTNRNLQSSRTIYRRDRETNVTEFPAPVAEDLPLKSYEVIALKLISQCSIEEGIAIGDLAREMHKIGLVQATSLAVNSLRRRGFIARRAIPSSEGASGVNVAGLRITPFGRRWLERNASSVPEAVPVSPPSEPSSLIDLLSTLRFRS